MKKGGIILLEQAIKELSKRGLSWGIILRLIYDYLILHYKGSQEECTNGKTPVFTYVIPKEYKFKIKKGKKIGDLMFLVEDSMKSLVEDEDLQIYEILSLSLTMLQKNHPEGEEKSGNKKPFFSYEFE